ncbi:DUF2220 family protein [Desulfuromonas carbonis]
MMEPGHSLLYKLLQSWQSNPDGERRKSLPIKKGKAEEYFTTTNPDEKDRLHGSLKSAERAGCVTLEWGRFHDSNILHKIWLVDGRALAEYLGEPIARDVASSSAQEILSRIPSDPWLRDILTKIICQWDKNKSAYRMPPGTVDDAVLLMKAIHAVRNNRQQGLDLRTFSAKELGNSKAMEKIRDRFARVWNERFDTGLDGFELFESLGLVKFPPMVCIKGPIEVQIEDSWIQVGSLPNYLGFPADAIRGIRNLGLPEFVLTVENLASFNRHCREIFDWGVVVYTGGFMGPTTAPVLQMLDKAMPDSIPFYHWGDIDFGGLNIARHVQSLLKRPLRLHLMSADLLRSYGKEPEQAVRSVSVDQAGGNLEIEALAEAARANSPYLVLEQENIDPRSPV